MQCNDSSFLFRSKLCLECGLLFHRDHSKRSKQLAVVMKPIELAAQWIQIPPTCSFDDICGRKQARSFFKLNLKFFLPSNCRKLFKLLSYYNFHRWQHAENLGFEQLTPRKRHIMQIFDFLILSVLPNSPFQQANNLQSNTWKNENKNKKMFFKIAKPYIIRYSIQVGSIAFWNKKFWSVCLSVNLWMVRNTNITLV